VTAKVRIGGGILAAWVTGRKSAAAIRAAIRFTCAPTMSAVLGA
jgi:hypothetical protein